MPDTTFNAFFVKQADFEQISGIPYSRIVWLGQYCTNDNVNDVSYIIKITMYSLLPALAL